MKLYPLFLSVAAVATAGLAIVVGQMSDTIESIDQSATALKDRVDSLDAASTGMQRAVFQAVCYHAYHDAIAEGTLADNLDVDDLGKHSLEVEQDNSEFSLSGEFDCTPYLNERMVDNECVGRMDRMAADAGQPFKISDIRNIEIPVSLTAAQSLILGPHSSVEEGVLSCSDHIVGIALEQHSLNRCAAAFESSTDGTPQIVLSEDEKEAYSGDPRFITDEKLDCGLVLDSI